MFIQELLSFFKFYTKPPLLVEFLIHIQVLDKWVFGVGFISLNQLIKNGCFIVRVYVRRLCENDLKSSLERFGFEGCVKMAKLGCACRQVLHAADPRHHPLHHPRQGLFGSCEFRFVYRSGLRSRVRFRVSLRNFKG